MEKHGSGRNAAQPGTFGGPPASRLVLGHRTDKGGMDTYGG
jgi:hypothetical protein